MNFWIIYLVGCLTAFIMHAEAQYYTKLRRNIKAKYPFDNFDEVCDALIVAVGSWVAVMILFFNDNDD